MMASAADGQQEEQPRVTFIKRNVGLTTVPAKVMALDGLAVLDLAHNQIEIVPKGLFPETAQLKTLDLSHNVIKALPDEVAALKGLEVLAITHNCLQDLPEGLFTLTALQDMNASYNQIDFIPNSIGNMEGLHVLNLAGNQLRAIPSDVGWLGLKQLNISDNPDLNLPAHVLQCGFKAAMSYLQVVGEQHQLVECHMAAFTARLTELQKRHGLQLGSVEDAAGVSLQLKVAQRLGIFSFRGSRMAVLPAALDDKQPALEGVQVVDCSRNRLKALPQQMLQAMPFLVVLNMSYNGVKALPAGIAMLQLSVLDLSFNKLALLPAELGQQMPRLQQLYLANNYLKELPESLGQMTGLQDLFLSENGFEAVPEVLRRCSSLAKLSLAACQLTGMADELQDLAGLRFLDVSFNRIKELPGSMSSLTGLAVLNLAYNPLGCFPEVLCSLTSLRELNVDHTGISSVPVAIGELRMLEGLQTEGCPLAPPLSSLYAKDPLMLVRLHDTQLQALDLSEAGLEEVPQALLRLTGLTSLDLHKNAIKDLPAGFGELRQLQQLSLKFNPLRQPHLRIIDAKGELALLSFMRSEGAAGCLDLEGCGFEALPKEVWQVAGRSALVTLNLTNNRMKDLPQELSSLVKLTQLVLDHNLLRHLPPLVLLLPALAVLMASSNSITYLPEGLGQMQQLQALLLNSNQLMQLPDSLTTLTNLRVLSLTSNRVWQLPPGIAGCASLRGLDCSHNLLSSLPAGMGGMSRLRSIKLTHNKLGWVPVSELLELPGLQELHLAGNPFNVKFTLGVELNVSDASALQVLLEALASSPAGQPPAPQPSYSRTVSSIYGNVSSYSPSMAESTGAAGAPDKLNDSQPGLPIAKQQAAGAKHGVVWEGAAGGSGSMSGCRTGSRGGSSAGGAVPEDGVPAIEARPVMHRLTSALKGRTQPLQQHDGGTAAAYVPARVRWIGSEGGGVDSTLSTESGAVVAAGAAAASAAAAAAVLARSMRFAEGLAGEESEEGDVDSTISTESGAVVAAGAAAASAAAAATVLARSMRFVEGLAGEDQELAVGQDAAAQQQQQQQVESLEISSGGVTNTTTGAAEASADSATAAGYQQGTQQPAAADSGMTCSSGTGAAGEAAVGFTTMAKDGSLSDVGAEQPQQLQQQQQHQQQHQPIVQPAASAMSTPCATAPAIQADASAGVAASVPEQATSALTPAAATTLATPAGQVTSSSTAGRLAAATAQGREAVQQENTATCISSGIAFGEARSKEQQQQQQQQGHSALDGVRLAVASLMSSTNSTSRPVQASSWDTIPLMDIPRIVKALAAAPPPPRPAASLAGPGDCEGEGVAATFPEGAAVQAPARPQTKARFRRVIIQTQHAMALLDRSMAAAPTAWDGVKQQGLGNHVAADETLQ